MCGLICVQIGIVELELRETARMGSCGHKVYSQLEPLIGFAIFSGWDWSDNKCILIVHVYVC